jgi:hypothetical protein
LTSWTWDGERLRLDTFNDTRHLAEAGVDVTRQSNV